jgi:multidrug efflux pump subunit AcrB
MIGLVDWAASRARMVVAFVILSLTVGTAAYVGLPKEGEPDIDIPGCSSRSPSPAFPPRTASACWCARWRPSFRIWTG